MVPRLPPQDGPPWVWMTKGSLTPRGYVLIYAPFHPRAPKGGYVYEHRLVMENTLGRMLERHEVVHHKDGDKTNNDATNLVLTTQSAHAREHAERGITYVNCVCDYCGASFQRQLGKFSRTAKNLYCSRVCTAKGSWVTRRALNPTETPPYVAKGTP